MGNSETKSKKKENEADEPVENQENAKLNGLNGLLQKNQYRFIYIMIFGKFPPILFYEVGIAYK